MPILWRYLLRNYFQTFVLCVFSFITVLFVMRFKEIAEFATLTSNLFSIFLFSVYQIPYILPIAIPISCLIASLLLFQKMSHNQELTALRASGQGLKEILYPIFMLGFVISLLNFTIVSEISPLAKSRSKELTYKMMSSNPFCIFTKISEGKLKNAYIDMHALKGGKRARDVVLILNNRNNGRLGIVTAKELSLEGDMLLGKDVTMISSIDAKRKESFDHLVIENQTSMETKAANLSDLVADSEWHTGIDYLPLRLVLAKAALKKNTLFSSIGTEIARRLSISLSPLFFTLMGSIFGIEISRQKKKRGVMLASLLAALYLASFVGAKSMKNSPVAAWAFYFLPFAIITALCLRCFKNLSKGVET